jgi:fido (protein-threonine AMPylation protein)
MNNLNNYFTFPSHIRTWVHPLENGDNTATPQEKKCYENALTIIEKLFIKVPLKSLTERQFHTMLALVHSQLVTDPADKAGQYRSEDKDQVVIGKMNFDDQDLQDPCFREIQPLIAKDVDIAEIVDKKMVSPAAIDFIHRHFHLCASPKKVYSSMETLRQELVKKLEEREDPIDIASFVHSEIGRIHPFMNANGRIARIFMNIVLMQSGHHPIAFANEQIYSYTMRDPVQFNQLVRNLSRMFDQEVLPIEPKAC